MKTLTRWLRSLQAQLILWAILPITLAVIALGFAGVYTHEHEMRDFVAERNQVLVRLTALRIEDGLVRGVIAPDGRDLAAWLPVEANALSGNWLVIDGTARVLAHTVAREVGARVGDTAGISEALVQREGSVIVSDAKRGAVLVNFAPVRGTDWVVLIQEPVESLLGPILRFSSLGPIAAVIAVGISLLILTFGWRTIVQPLQQVAQAAGQVSWGDHTAIHQKVGGVAEIHDLHEALVAMVERLEGYETGVHDYLGALTQGQETERARLARELHDGAVQELIALGQRLEITRRMVDRGEDARARELLEDLRVQQVATVEELRRIIGDLRPVYLEDLGFIPALEMLVRTANKRNEVEVRLEHGPQLRRLSADVELAAYRVTQEALNNALQHARARHITVRVACNVDGMELTIADDGVGFVLTGRPDSLTRAGRFGLVGLWERVRQMGGTLRIDTAPGSGTKISAWFPDSVEPRELAD